MSRAEQRAFGDDRRDEPVERDGDAGALAADRCERREVGAVGGIELEKLLDRKKNELKMGKIEAEIIVEREKALVNSEFIAAFA